MLHDKFIPSKLNGHFINNQDFFQNCNWNFLSCENRVEDKKERKKGYEMWSCFEHLKVKTEIVKKNIKLSISGRDGIER